MRWSTALATQSSSRDNYKFFRNRLANATFHDLICTMVFPGGHRLFIVIAEHQLSYLEALSHLQEELPPVVPKHHSFPKKQGQKQTRLI